MKKKVTFLELNLHSALEKKALQVNLNHPKIILYGTNNTGKSVIIRHIFWCMGLNPINVFSKIWDQNITGILKILYDNEEYSFYRNKDNRYLFHDEVLLFSSSNNTEWNSYLAIFFKYPLKLLLKSSPVENDAGLEGLLVPYFIEQDSGWGLNWAGPFSGLARFKDFYKEVLINFTGYKSIESISLRQQLGTLKSEFSKLNSELSIYKISFNNIKIDTSYNQPRVNKNSFRKEIKQSTNELKSLIIQQNNLKNTLSELIQKKFKLKSILKSSVQSLNEISLDIEFLNKNFEIECPTCGTLHKKTNEASTILELDYSALENNILQIKTEILDLNKKIIPLNSSLADIESNIDSFNKNLKKTKNNISFQDLIDVEANRLISKSFEKNTKKLNADINILENKISHTDEIVKKLESKEHQKQIKSIFEKKLKFNLNQLNISFNGKINQIQSRPDIGGGSSNPRAILALHMTYLELSLDKTSLPIFPFVIDTPQQNGQDMVNLSNTFNHLENINFTQLIIGSETLPVSSNISNYKIIKFEKEFSVLNEESFEEVSNILNNYDVLLNANIVV